MKFVKLYFYFQIIFLVSCVQQEPISHYAPTETYPADTILNSLVENKRALVITAHDDDMCMMAGTVSKLNRAGWKIFSLVFSDSDEERNKAHQRATAQILDSVIFIDLKGEAIRYDLDSGVLAYEAIPKSKFATIFNYEGVTKELTKIVNEFSPSVLFTLDNEIGGYGHPGHVFISQLALDLSTKGIINPKYIYQNVMTDHMEKTIIDERHSRRMKSWGFKGDGFLKARRIYKVNGMPKPDVEVNIFSEAEEKMNYLRSYNERERKTIGFFIPAFEQYEALEYFAIFDREFFRVIKID